MKIESLKFKNINSLKGEWRIDFLSNEFIENGIFAIVGETGAGKSSILDAITLALYGKTPRQRDINSSKNNLMTKLTAECYSEVIFRGKDNRRYRSRWYQHRAKKRADGKLQTPRVLLEEVNKKTVATKIEEWREAVEDATRLDFDRFCKCVMLAQGNFSAFLRANEREKSEILEQITNTSLYKKIGKRVFQEAKERRVELDRLKERLETLKPLILEDRKEHEDRFKELKNSLRSLKSQIEDLREKKSSILFFNREQEELHRAKENLIKLKSELNEIKETKSKLQELFKKAQKEIDEFYSEDERREELITKVEKLDILFNEKKKLEVKYQKEIAKLKSAIEDKSKKLDKFNNIKSVDESKDELFSLKEQYLTKRYLCYEYNRIKNSLNGILEELRIKKEDYSNIETKIVKKAKTLEELKANLQIGELALKVLELRRYLEDNEPCLVCGSRTHNIEAVGDIPTNIDIDEIKEKIELLTKELNGLKVEKEVLKETIRTLREKSSTLQKELKQIEDDIKDCNSLEIEKKIDNIDEKISILETYQQREEILNQIDSKKDKIALYTKELEDIQKEIKENRDLRDELFYGDIKEYKKDIYKKRVKLLEKRELITKDLDSIENQQREIEFIIDGNKRTVEIKTNTLKNIKNIIDNFDLDSLNRELLEKERDISLKNQELGKIELLIKRDDEVRARYKEIKIKLESQMEDLEVLDTLNNLIGSSDGAKFAKFAQTITMDYLLILANRHLKHLDKRYKIIQKGILDFVVVDRYQADEIRPVSTLSGGESFIVSLALALGLSDLAGENINIETLFLDEGFGTLDAQTLETILSSLDRLNSQGKMIGIISHIEAIKDAISLKIEVKKSGGFGYLNPKYRI